MADIASKLVPLFDGPALDADRVGETANALIMKASERLQLVGLADQVLADALRKAEPNLFTQDELDFKDTSRLTSAQAALIPATFTMADGTVVACWKLTVAAGGAEIGASWGIDRSSIPGDAMSLGIEVLHVDPATGAGTSVSSRALINQFNGTTALGTTPPNRTTFAIATAAGVLAPQTFSAANVAINALATQVRFVVYISGVGSTTARSIYFRKMLIAGGTHAVLRDPPFLNLLPKAYVNSSGADSANGGPASPYNLIAKAAESIGYSGEIKLAPGDYSAAQSINVANINRELVITGSDDFTTYKRPILRFGQKLTGIAATAGYDDIFEATMTIASGQPHWIWDDDAPDPLTLVPVEERHGLLRGRANRLPVTRMVHVTAANATAAKVAMHASPNASCYYDAAATKLYVKRTNGNSAIGGNLYVSAVQSDGLFTGTPLGAFGNPLGRARVIGIDLRYGGINLRNFVASDLFDVRSFGAPLDGCNAAWEAQLRMCEFAGHGSMFGDNGDGLSMRNRGIIQHWSTYAHDGWDDGASPHQGMIEESWDAVAEYNYGNGLVSALGAQSRHHRPTTRKNAVGPRLNGDGTPWKYGGIAAIANPLDGNALTWVDVDGGRSFDERVGFYDAASNPAASERLAVLKAVGCQAINSATYGFQCTLPENPRYGGTGTGLAPGVVPVRSAAL